MIRQLLLLILTPSLLWAEAQTPHHHQFGEVIIASFASAPFPHPQRAHGHYYQGKYYSANTHYQDSRVAIFIPKGYLPTTSVDLIFHFHGWFGSVEQVLGKYQLAKQLYESGKNAILVLPQGPLNAPDSFGGKLEEQDGFEYLAKDIVDYLHAQGKVGGDKIGNVILSGHSGAYRVISSILARGGMPEHIREVYLFDALYGQSARYLAWLKQHRGKLIAVYTQSGGTQRETERLITALRREREPILMTREEELSPADLKSDRLVFISTRLGHDQVVHARAGFKANLWASLLANRAI